MSSEPQYIDCLAEFQQELAKLSTWDLRCLANINKENFISVTEACDPETDAMVGWEKYTTLTGLVAKKGIPDVTKLTDAETLNLFDNLLSREFATLDGQRILLGPFACVYLHDVEGLCKGNDAVYYYVKSFLASTNLLYSICGEANVLENEELMFQCQEVLGLSQGTDTEAVIAGLSVAAAAATNADLKLRLELRAQQLKSLLTVFLSHSIANADVEAALTDAAQIANDMRAKLIPSRRKIGAITTDAKFFPNDVRYWLTTNTTATSSNEPDLTEQLEKVAAFYASIANFTAFAPCKNFFEIAVVAEKVATTAPCALTRPFAYAYIFRDRPTEQPARLARGDRLLGDKSLRMSVLKYLENDLGAPLYWNLLDSSVAPATNPHLLDVAHYVLACSSGHSGVKTPAGQLAMVQQQVLQSLFRWLEMAASCVTDLIQSALFNTGRHQRRVANRLSDLNQLHNYSWEVDQRIFRCHTPQNVTDATHGREMSHRASVLTAFTTDLICDSMEKFVRLTMRLDLPTKPEYIACTWYLDLIASTRMEQFHNVVVKPSDRGVVIPERKVNKRTGNPLAAPALTSRTAGNVNSAIARADIARQIAEASFMVFAIFQTHNLVSGFENAVSTSLTTAEQMFDHRFEFFSRVRVPALPPFSACVGRVRQLKAVPLYTLIVGTITSATETSELAKSSAAESNGSVFADELSALEKSIRALAASMRLLKTLLFANVAEGTTAVPDPTTEEVEKALAGYEIALEAPYDKSIVIPVLRKKAE